MYPKNKLEIGEKRDDIFLRHEKCCLKQTFIFIGIALRTPFICFCYNFVEAIFFFPFFFLSV